MRFSLRFRSEFASDLNAGRRWYEERSPGLGAVFAIECSKCLTRIQRNSDWVAPDSDGVRTIRLSRFPYVIHFLLEKDLIVVLAVMFGGRDRTSQGINREAPETRFHRCPIRAPLDRPSVPVGPPALSVAETPIDTSNRPAGKQHWTRFVAGGIMS
jgi:hypothetical protein